MRIHFENTLCFLFVCLVFSGIPVHSQHTRYMTNAGLLLGQRRRRWPSSKPALIDNTDQT